METTREARGRLIIVCGLLAAGKTTHALRLANESHAVRFSADDWMKALSIDLFAESERAKIEALQWKLAQELLVLGVTVIVEWGTWARSERNALRSRARELGATVELHYVTAPNDVLLKRLKDRGWPGVTPEMLRGWIESFEGPNPEELALYDKQYVLETGSVSR